MIGANRFARIALRIVRATKIQGIFRVFSGIVRGSQAVFRLFFPIPFTGIPFGPFSSHAELMELQLYARKEVELSQESQDLILAARQMAAAENLDSCCKHSCWLSQPAYSC